MVVYILRLRRVELHNALVLAEKHILNRAHLVPCRAALALCRAGRNADVLPAHSIACDHPERLAANIHLKNTVSAVAGAAVKLTFPVFQPKLVQLCRSIILSTSIMFYNILVRRGFRRGFPCNQVG